MYSEYANNLIISTDDFGISENANRNILRLAREKKIDRTSVMIGGKLPEEDVKAILETGIKLDIHLHLLDRKYFETRRGESSRNVPKRLLLFLVDLTSGRFAPSKVKLIWKKQIEDFKDVFGRYPDGLNSHEHMHYFPLFFRLALSLKDKFSIPYMRLGQKESSLKKKTSISRIISLMRKMDVRRNHLEFAPPGEARLYPGELNTSDYMASFDWITDPNDFFEHIPEKGQTEIVFHPERDEEFGFLMENF